MILIHAVSIADMVAEQVCLLFQLKHQYVLCNANSMYVPWTIDPNFSVSS